MRAKPGYIWLQAEDPEGTQRVIRQSSNPESVWETSSSSPLPTPSPAGRRKSFIPGVGRGDKLATVVSESIRLNGAIHQMKEVGSPSALLLLVNLSNLLTKKVCSPPVARPVKSMVQTRLLTLFLLRLIEGRPATSQASQADWPTPGSRHVVDVSSPMS